MGSDMHRNRLVTKLALPKCYVNQMVLVETVEKMQILYLKFKFFYSKVTIFVTFTDSDKDHDAPLTHDQRRLFISKRRLNQSF